MRQATRKFTLEFKQEAVQLLETSCKSGIALAKELGISDSVLYRWRKELRANGEAAFPGKGHQTD
jgi:transposase